MNYIIFDLEATCEKDDRFFDHEIIEIGAVKVSQNFEIVDEFTTFVRPTVNPILTAFCKELTTIKQEDVDNAVTFPEAFKSFRQWIGEDTFKLLSWGGYDRKQIERDCIRWKANPNWVKQRHTNLKALHADLVLNGGRQVGMYKALNLAKIKLEGTHHRGIDDARNIAKIFINYQDKWNL